MNVHSGVLALIAASLTLVLGGCGGGDSHQKVADDIAMQLDRLATAMGGVTDKASAEKAVGDMKAIVEDMKKIGARAKALGEPNAELKARIEGKVQRQLQEKLEQLQKSMAALQTTMMKAGPEATAIIMKGMTELAPELNEVSHLFGEASRK